MNKLALLSLTLAISINAPAFAHDMGAMKDMDGDSAPNAMGGQMGMGAHMVMTDSRPQTPQDVERAHDVMNTLRRALVKYHNYRVALSEHYEIFLPTVPQDVYHFTDYATAQQEYTGHFDPAHPGSLLYVKNSSGDYILVGAMYSAPADYTPDQLNEFIPLSVAHWHAHTNICLPNGVTLDDILRGDVGALERVRPGNQPATWIPRRRTLRLHRQNRRRVDLQSRRRPPARSGVRLDGPRLSIQRRRPESSLRHDRPETARQLMQPATSRAIAPLPSREGGRGLGFWVLSKLSR